VKVISDLGSEQLSIENLRLYDEVTTLTSAIEEAIIRGQRSIAVLGDIPESGVATHEDFERTSLGAGPGVVGWADDF